MTIHEPNTVLTDGLLALLAGWLAWRLGRRRPPGPVAARWWCGALGLTALSALVGGSFHGFSPNFSTEVAGAWWVATLLAISLISAAMAMGLLAEVVTPERQRPWHTVIAFKLLAFGSVILGYPHFVVAIIDYGLTMVAWAVAAVCLRRAWSGWMLAAIGLSVGAAVVQQLHLAPSAQFNHNDLYHVIQAGALVCFQAAGKRFTGPAVR